MATEVIVISSQMRQEPDNILTEEQELVVLLGEARAMCQLAVTIYGKVEKRIKDYNDYLEKGGEVITG